MSNIFPDFDELTEYEPNEYEHDAHAVVSVQLVELIDGNWLRWYDISTDGEIIPNEDWVWDYYNLEQYKRVCDKFNARFMWDEIGMLPPLRWKQQVIRLFNEIMPKYKMIYSALDAGIDPFQNWGRYGKSRHIFSEFPETLLGGNADYVSNGNDREYEDIEQGSFVDKIADLNDKYNDVDVLILNHFEKMFSGLIAINVNGF